MRNAKKPTKANWFSNNPRKTITLFLLITNIILISGVEWFLRLRGEQPEAKLLIKTVEKLEVFNSFFTDSEGVFKCNKDYTDWGKRGIQINTDGFRSIEFKKYNSNAKKILFLGDSFTWGASANPIQNCFVDLIARQGYLTFNTGIPGAGPNQYAYLAEKYIPLLRPDVVAVMLYMGNDINNKPDPMIPHKNLWHETNAGLIEGFDLKGNPLSAQESYNYYILGSNLKIKIKNKIKSTVIGTKLFYAYISIKEIVVHRLKSFLLRGASSNGSNKQSLRSLSESLDKKNMVPSNYTTEELIKIKKACDKYRAKFILFIIPVAPRIENARNKFKGNEYVFEKFNPFVPKNLTKEDYTLPPDNHFNNSGHFKFSRFVIGMIEKQMMRVNP